MPKATRDIPVPMPRGIKYGYATLEPGESIFVNGEKSNGKAASGARSHGQYFKKRFVVRKEGSGIRIWREK